MSWLNCTMALRQHVTHLLSVTKAHQRTSGSMRWWISNLVRQVHLVEDTANLKPGRRCVIILIFLARWRMSLQKKKVESFVLVSNTGWLASAWSWISCWMLGVSSNTENAAWCTEYRLLKCRTCLEKWDSVSGVTHLDNIMYVVCVFISVVHEVAVNWVVQLHITFTDCTMALRRHVVCLWSVKTAHQSCSMWCRRRNKTRISSQGKQTA